MRTSFCFILLFTIISCGEAESKVPSIIGDEHNAFFSELQVENTRRKHTMMSEFNNFIGINSDEDLRNKAEVLLGSITNAERFIDSLRQMMTQIKGSDAENLYFINKLIGEGALGDTLRHHFENVFDRARDAIVLDEQRTSIDSIQLNLTGSSTHGGRWQAELFGMTNPVGATIILYGLEGDLYSVGTISFR